MSACASPTTAGCLVSVDDLDRVWRYGSGEAGGAPRPAGRRGLAGQARCGGGRDRAGRQGAGALAWPMRAEATGPALTRAQGLCALRRPLSVRAQRRPGGRDRGDPRRSRPRRPPMDRLLCGDVGFGKTEVAIRAAAVAALNGRQVAVLAPTTLLVAQHLQTFRRRFAGLGAARRAAFAAGTARRRAGSRRLADGSIEIVVGTHALAAPELRFADLALVIDRRGAALRHRPEGGAEPGCATASTCCA